MQKHHHLTCTAPMHNLRHQPPGVGFDKGNARLRREVLVRYQSVSSHDFLLKKATHGARKLEPLKSMARIFVCKVKILRWSDFHFSDPQRSSPFWVKLDFSFKELRMWIALEAGGRENCVPDGTWEGDGSGGIRPFCFHLNLYKMFCGNLFWFGCLFCSSFGFGWATYLAANETVCCKRWPGALWPQQTCFHLHKNDSLMTASELTSHHWCQDVLCFDLVSGNSKQLVPLILFCLQLLWLWKFSFNICQIIVCQKLQIKADFRFCLVNVCNFQDVCTSWRRDVILPKLRIWPTF